MIENVGQLNLGSTTKNSSSSSGTGTQGPELTIPSIRVPRFHGY